MYKTEEQSLLTGLNNANGSKQPTVLAVILWSLNRLSVGKVSVEKVTSLNLSERRDVNERFPQLRLQSRGMEDKLNEPKIWQITLT